MDYNYYIFAFFVFCMLAAAVYLHDRLKRSRLEQEDGKAQRERKLFQLYQNLEDMIDSMELFIQDTKTEIRRDKESINTVLFKMEQMYKTMDAAMISSRQSIQHLDAAAANEAVVGGTGPAKPRRLTMAPAIEAHHGVPQVQSAPRQAAPAKRPDIAPPKQEMTKSQRVRKLMQMGYDADRIAQELAISRGEVSLIMDLHKN